MDWSDKMADETIKDEAGAAATADPTRATCGLVMPISKTANHSEQHWADVQSLLHRAIFDAGFEPENAWAGDLTDRLSERIVANIFTYDMVVVDISDLNPNVMLELGLRLSSKKPTIVVCDDPTSIPFDIRDFRALVYPSDLNILGMEKFFVDLGRALIAKSSAYASNEYQPFLGSVIIDVLQPQKRDVSMGDIVVERLDEISRRLSRLETTSTRLPKLATNGNARIGSRSFEYFSIPSESANDFTAYASGFSGPASMSPNGNVTYVQVPVPDDEIYGNEVRGWVLTKAKSVGGVKDNRPEVVSIFKRAH